MENKPLLSIAIPTYNRVLCLERLLKNILAQTEKFKTEVQICISNNGSPDNTHEVVVNFERKYPGLIKYSENKENLGFSINLIKVMEMAEGDFIWLLGDDDLVVEDGVEKVIGFLKNHCDENTGLVSFAEKEYFIDEMTKKETVYADTIEKDKPGFYKTDRKDVIEPGFPGNAFISVLIFNNKFLEDILKNDKAIIEEAVKINDYIHVFLYRLMFLKFSFLEAIRFNEIIINQQLPHYKIYVEDKFRQHYTVRVKLADLLMSGKYMEDKYKKMLIDNKKRQAKGIIFEMGLMKSFKTFNYFSLTGCFKMFFQQAPFADALLLSGFFTAFLIIPSVILRNLCKFFIKIRHKKNWQKVWDCIAVAYTKMPSGSRRLMT